ncbi:MAG TPA: methyltransferase domain-containing protein [Bryobacteraceae bacterium]|nr:methyltransferase domain-containing protein [Bryobacteraceae bacterium]
MRGRRIARELLDDAGAEEASASLGDLRRINRWLGGHRILPGIVRSWYQTSDFFTVLDVGAASGDMGAALRKQFPNATVVSLDRKVRNLRTAPHPKVASDAFHLPFLPASFDVVCCSLFLHHFDNDAATTLLRAMHGTARRGMVVIDLERHWMAHAFLPATRWLFGWHPITLHDGPVSVSAAFVPSELHDLARRAGLPRPLVRRHYPWFRLSLVTEK